MNLSFELNDAKHNFELGLQDYKMIEDKENRIAYFVIVGNYTFDNEIKNNGKLHINFDVGDDIEKVCIKDKRGGIKILWSKAYGEEYRNVYTDKDKYGGCNKKFKFTFS